MRCYALSVIALRLMRVNLRPLEASFMLANTFPE